MNTYLEDFTQNTLRQEIEPLPVDEIIDIIYHSMPNKWKNKMIEQGFNHTYYNVKEMKDIFETRVKNLEPKEDKKLLHSP